MTIKPDAQMYDYQTGVATKLVPMSDGTDTYAPAAVVFQPLAPGEFDYIACSYTGANLTGVVYKLGGSGGTTATPTSWEVSGVFSQILMS